MLPFAIVKYIDVFEAGSFLAGMRSACHGPVNS